MELVIELDLLCGASLGVTYEQLHKHTVTIDLLVLRLTIAYGPEEAGPECEA